MPLARYFVYVGGFLLALLFLVDWYLPQGVLQAERTEAQRSVIRIHSAHKWPSAVVFDTTQPTIVPPQQPALAAAEKAPAPAKSPRDAHAMAQPADVPATAAAHPTPPKQVKRRAKVARRPAAERFASYDTFGFRPFFQMGW